MSKYKRSRKHAQRPSDIERFYRSDEWRLERAVKICDCNGLCDLCCKPGKEVYNKIRLTINNVDYPSISVN